MEAAPLVSVVIPVFNGEPYLAETIESVIAQTYRPIEIIVVDDGSTDLSAVAAKRFGPPVRYRFQSNAGTAAARNFGVRSARGSFFAFLDQDDLWAENKLTLQIEAFEREPTADVVFGHVRQFHSPGLDPSLKKRIQCPSSLMPGYSPSAMLVKREAFFHVGEFETAWRVGEWANWYVRAVERKLQMIMLPELIALRRLHDSNKGILQHMSINEYPRILKASLDRRRTLE
ncbi:MAG: glycosyltransferase family 2 protein [Deltaproteobacteria bacterium]|nr:glycosyltransferase family 2 protein [Deltaproteobacteria bacterium]